jgi:hypothetical protein
MAVVILCAGRFNFKELNILCMSVLMFCCVFRTNNSCFFKINRQLFITEIHLFSLVYECNVHFHVDWVRLCL